MKLPASIQIFLEAEKGAGDIPPVRAFAPDAIVRDEGKTHVGSEAIETWWCTAKAQYRHTAEALEIMERGDLTVVRARVTGRFAGSPALLTFAFRLENGRITALEIGG